MGSDEYEKIDENSWLGDTGASVHICTSEEGIYDKKKCDLSIKVGDNKTVQAIMKGKKDFVQIMKNGNRQSITLSEVYVVPEMYCNLLSLTAAMKAGFILKSTKEGTLELNKGNKKFPIDRKVATREGYLLMTKLIPKEKSKTSFGKLSTGSKININEFHSLLGHPGEAKMRSTAKAMGIILTGNLHQCVHCPLAKARQRNMNKKDNSMISKKGERLCIDISSVSKVSISNKRFWLLVLDENTSYKWSFFLKTKSDQVQVLIEHIMDLEAKEGVKVKYIRCDNAGENLSLEKECKRRGLGITFEYTAPNTPQQNGKVERAFATLYGRVRAMLNQASLTSKMRGDIWTEAASTATKLENAISSENAGKSPHELFFGKSPSYLRELQYFGHMCIVKESHRGKMIGKLDNRGTLCMFLGYSSNHSGDTYRLLNLKTYKVILSRDVTWLNKTYGDYHHISKSKHVTYLEHEDELDKDQAYMNSESGKENREENEFQNNEDQEDIQPKKATTVSQRTNLNTELRRLNTFYNPTTYNQNKSNDVMLEMAHVVIDVGMYNALVSDPKEPETFQSACNHQDKDERDKWRESIKKELNSMIDKKVWEVKKKHEIPSDRRLIGSKWVFKRKKNGVYRSRLCALGYSQIPGLDFTDNFAPVVNEITFRILIGASLIEGWNAEVIDV
jgi:transposase InsO family protein